MKLCPKCQKQFSDDANFCPVDAARLAPLEGQAGGADSLSARFDIGAQLGGSRTGAVYRATDKTTGKPCVVKIVSRAVVALPGVAQRLERELKQLERVNSAGVAKVITSGKRNEDTWVAIEMLEGAQTLAEAIGARGPIPPDQAADLIEVIGEALIEAAQVGVVHRDLAPKNVLFAGQDVKLVNFSLPVPTSDKVPGVPEYVSPEQVDGRSVDQRSNLYSLGALYYFVLTGGPPFMGTTEQVHQQHQTGTIRPPSEVATGVHVPAAVEAVIMRALDRSPTKRFLTVRQFVDEVMRVGHGEVIELKPSTPRPVARPKGELVQTLMGIRGGAQAVQAAVMQAQAAHAQAAQAPMQPAPPVVAPVVQAAQAPQPRAGSNPANPMTATVIGVPAGALGNAAPAPAPQVAPPQGSSPWAPPGIASAPTAPAPALAAQPRAASQPAAPVVAAPVVAAPVVAAAPAGKKKTDDAGGGAKGKFRETMWFKKGDLDAQAAVAAAEERARTGKVVDQDKADSLPIDERYKDDGSISRSDKEKYSLRTGSTMMMDAVRDPLRQDKPRGGNVSEDALIGEMKGGRNPVLIAIAIGIMLIAAIVYFITR